MTDIETASVLVDGETITGKVYHVRDNGWLCVETPEGRIASGPSAITCECDTSPYDCAVHCGAVTDVSDGPYGEPYGSSFCRLPTGHPGSCQ